MDSKVFLPIRMGWPVVVRLKNAKSSGSRQGRVLSMPMPLWRSVATIRVRVADMIAE
jgi:hypothetical protein